MSNNNEDLLMVLQLAIQATESTSLALRSTLEALNQQRRQQDEDKWTSLTEAATALGSGFSADMLRERCNDGRFKYGTHFINSSDGPRANYLIRVAAVRKYFETEPEKRSSAKLRRVV